MIRDAISQVIQRACTAASKALTSTPRKTLQLAACSRLTFPALGFRAVGGAVGLRSWLLRNRLLRGALTAARLCASLPAALFGTALLLLPHALSLAISCLAFSLHRCKKIQALHEAGTFAVWASGLVGFATLKCKGEMHKRNPGGCPRRRRGALRRSREHLSSGSQSDCPSWPRRWRQHRPQCRSRWWRRSSLASGTLAMSRCGSLQPCPQLDSMSCEYDVAPYLKTCCYLSHCKHPQEPSTTIPIAPFV